MTELFGPPGSRRAPTGRRWIGAATALLVVGVAVVASPLPLAADVARPPGGRTSLRDHRPGPTTVTVELHSDRGRASTTLLGANHHFVRNGYGLWDPRADAPVPAVVSEAIRAGVQSLRFPGGSVANLYDWKRAIGPDRGCQVVGPKPGSRARAVTDGLAFGPDEYMRFVDRIHARPLIMMPFVTETPSDAADWVEYMNAPAGAPGNPHGGTDWADVRAANGHPAPYGVHWWEIGNEQHHEHSRYWMSQDDGRAVRQYAFGGSSRVTGERLGKHCAHPRSGIRSDGTAGQAFEALYPPVAARDFRIAVGGTRWRRVDDLSAAGPRAKVFTLDPSSGVVRFGDGTRGAVPPRGLTVDASYRTVHRGYFAFARAMKEVDPSIEVCSSWGDPLFDRTVGHRPYDCLTAHAITVFTSPRGRRPRWSGPLEGHDRFMMKSDSTPTRVRELRRGMPRSTPLLLTEFVTMHGDARAYPTWASSVSHAVYMASLWAAWLQMRIRWGDGDDFLWSSDRAVLGPAPHYVFTADAVTRQALAPMFSAGGTVLATRVAGNPVRRPPRVPGSYPALKVAATRARGVVRILVVNRLPLRDVAARVTVRGGTPQGIAVVRSVGGPSFASRNDPAAPHRVRLRVRTRPSGAARYVFPPASTTVIELRLR